MMLTADEEMAVLKRVLRERDAHRKARESSEYGARLVRIAIETEGRRGSVAKHISNIVEA